MESMGHRCFNAAITTFLESSDKKMDEKDVLGMLGIIAAAAWLILFILAWSMDSARMGDVLILSAFAGVLAMIFFTICD